MHKYIHIFIFIFSFLFLDSQRTKNEEVIDITKNLKADQLILEKNYYSIANDTAALKRFLNLSIQNNNKTSQCYFLNKLGVFYRDKADYEKAMRYNNAALEIANRSKNIEQKIITINLVGVIYRRKDDIIPAISNHQKALLLCESIKNPNETILRNIAISCNSLGNIYLTMNQLDDALAQFKRSLEIEKSIGNKLGLAINYQNIGGIFEKRDQLDSALVNYRKSLYYNLQINSGIGELICNNSIGAVYLKKNDVKNAALYILPTISQSRKFQDDFYTSTSYINTGWLHFLQGNPDAEKIITEGLKIAQTKGYRSTKIDAFYLLYQINEKNKSYEKAIDYYKKFHQEKESLNSETTLRNIVDLKNKYFIEKKKNEINELKNEHDKILMKLNKDKLIFAVLLFLSVLLGLLYYFFSRQKRLQQEKKILLMEQDLLRLQMNPHFIFNALNSIKAYVLKSDVQNAVFYLNKFAKLVRTILTGIQKKEFNMKDELETIENYVSLENMRFGGDIKFSIQKDEDIMLENIKVPSLLLQVFVENAIWHGLSLKEGEKILKIGIYKIDENFVAVDVFDNGVGRKRTMELKEQNSPKKESLGLKISKQRLENLFSGNYKLEINDLHNDHGNPSGTCVHIELPYHV